jgi:hypothetical protein
MFFITSRDTAARLADVAAEVFRALGVTEWEERDSSNYPPDNHYFAGYCENVEVEVYDGDDDRTADYPFHVSVEEASWRKGPGVVSTDVATLAKALVTGGFTVFVPMGAWWRTDWKGDGDVYAA